MRRGVGYARIVAYLSAALGVAAVTAVCAPFQATLNNTTVAMGYLLVVLFTATRWGSWPAILAAVIGGLAFDYYFLPPIGSFTIGEAQDWLALTALFVTARRRAVLAEAGQQAARQESAYNRALIEASLDPLVTLGSDGKITDVNAAVETITGRSRAEIIGTDFADYFTDPERARAGYEQAFREGFVRDYALALRHDEGPVPVLYNAAAYRDETGTVVGVFAAARDISGLKRAESEVRHLATFPRDSPIAIIEFDRKLQVRFINRSMQKLLDACSIDDPRLLVPPSQVARLAQDGEADTTEFQETQIGEHIFDERFFFSSEFQTVRVYASDITERKQAERALARLNGTLLTLFNANQALVRATSEPELLDTMCKVLIEIGGYRMAWIGFAENDAAKTVRVAAVAGHDDGYTAQAQVSWADSERGHGPTGTAIRTGEPQLNRDFATAPDLALWRAAALERGYASSVALPLRGASGVFGALTIYAAERDAFGPDDVKLFIDMAGDLAYGIAALRAGIEREQAVRRLSDSFEDTVGALASTVEARDPYTAGHQRRVATLGAAIAREMGLPQDRIRGLFFAGLIHDVGKIQVPAEILSKPGGLSPLEKQFVRMHVQAGYDIIKGVDFPWPIAEIVLQHHERLDGSGYPRGLAADAIILEARILAVADVIEAIAAHRPYRSAQGLDAALAEIDAGKGRLYDAAAVEACIDLFRNKGFVFP
jgi:PAS domain S-box-containing protein